MSQTSGSGVLSRLIGCLTGSLALLWAGSVGVQAQAPAPNANRPKVSPPQQVQPLPPEFNKDLLNFNTVGIITSKSYSTYLAIAEDLATVLDDGDNLRVLAVVGKGASQNVRDILFLRNVDVGVTLSNVLAHHKKVGGLGPGLDSRLVYITKLFNEEVHVIAGAGATDIRSLSGKVVNFGDVGGSSEFTARLIFDALKINVKAVNLAQNDALHKIKTGEVAATVLVTGKPSVILERLATSADYKLLSIPFEEALDQDYLPTQFTNADYPRLLGENERVDTVAVSAVLAAYNWPPSSDRGRRLVRFVESFFAKFPELKKEPRHPKWREVNLTATVPGWQRLPAAKQWLDKNAPQVARVPTGSVDTSAGAGSDIDRTKKAFDSFISSQDDRRRPNAGQPDQDALFAQFLEWMSSQRAQSSRPAATSPAAAPQQRQTTPPAAPPATRLW